MSKVVRIGFPTPPFNYYKIYVYTITFNQAQYIEDCLNGVAMQNTSFPFVHHVVDDCSTDGEQGVINGYLNKETDIENAEFYDNEICTITVTKVKKNTNCTLAVYFLKKNMFGDPLKEELFRPWQKVCIYEAICEGDDFWIDPKKLQKQADFLDSNIDYGLCCTNYKMMNNKTKEVKEVKLGERDISYRALLKGNRLSTLTSLCRVSLLLKYFSEISPLKEGWIQGDYPAWLFFSYHSKVRYLSDCTACYRINEGSLSRPMTLDGILTYIDSVYSIKLYFIEHFKGDVDLKDDLVSEKYYYRARACLRNKEYKKAYKEIKKCPYNIKILAKVIVKIILDKP